MAVESLFLTIRLPSQSPRFHERQLECLVEGGSVPGESETEGTARPKERDEPARTDKTMAMHCDRPPFATW
jgi:hypothetical protein